MIPCIKNKCLKLPICKSKNSVDCTELNNFIHESLPQAIEETYIHLKQKALLWNHINETLPLLEQALPDKEKGYPSHLLARHARTKYKSDAL